MTTAATGFGMPALATTEDAFLGERIRVRQPAKGYRAGIDAVLLAASLAPDTAGNVLDCGAGVGTVGLCVAARLERTHVTLVERERELADLAHANIAVNGLEQRVRIVVGDLTRPALAPGSPDLAPETFDNVLANPPFHDRAGGTPAAHALKQASHAMETDALDAWMRFAVRMARPGGRLAVIHKADALPALLDTLQGRFGGVSVVPIHPYADRDAIRVLVTGIKGSRAGFALKPPLVLHVPDGAFTPRVSRILRQGAGLEENAADAPGIGAGGRED